MRPTPKLPLLLLGAMLASCGSPAPEPAPVAELPSEDATERGIILGLRPLGTTPEGRLRLVSQVVGAAQGAGSAAPNAVEVIIRLERGRDMALIQPAEAWLQPGQRVVITPGLRPALARDTRA